MNPSYKLGKSYLTGENHKIQNHQFEKYFNLREIEGISKSWYHQSKIYLLKYLKYVSWKIDEDKTLKYIKPLFKNEMRNMGFDLLLAYYDVWTMKFTYFSIGATKPFISQNGKRYRTDDHPYIFSDFSQELLDKLKINGLKEGCNVINGSIGPAVNVIILNYDNY